MYWADRQGDEDREISRLRKNKAKQKAQVSALDDEGQSGDLLIDLLSDGTDVGQFWAVAVDLSGLTWRRA